MPKAKSKKAFSQSNLQVPLIIGFVNQKGGAGKSTGATHASVWFKRQSYSVVLVDADGQQSSSDWIKHINSLRESEEPYIPYVINSDPEELFKLGVPVVNGPKTTLRNFGQITDNNTPDKI